MLRRTLRHSSFSTFLFLSAGILLSTGASRSEAAHADTQPTDRLVVHEWGTFTSLQDEAGRTIAGINTDDEPLPDFVHNIHGLLLQSPSDLPPIQFKGVSRVHPDVLVRLETPVIYFYPPAGIQSFKADVEVAFHGGWLSQYYPDAKAVAPGVQPNREIFGPLTSATVSTLSWNNLTVSGKTNGPATTSRVWLAPREVQATSVTTPEGERERYLFYRGVGKIEAPFHIVRSTVDARILDIRAAGSASNTPATRAAWLVDVRPDGKLAFRSIGAIPAKGEREIATTVTAEFADQDYDNALTGIRRELHTALVQDGLYADEAEAMLNTWEASYFCRPGLRVFFMVPRAWTDATLPLKVKAGELTEKMVVERAMIGRIELVTPAQRDLLLKITKTPPTNGGWLWKSLEKARASRTDAYREDWFRKLMNGETTLAASNVEMPNEFRDYLELGRFRNALILDELTRRPSANLKKFVEEYGLKYSEVDSTVAQ